MIYTAREFITMDPARPRAEAIAVKDGKFVAVGTRAQVGAAVGKDANLTILEESPYAVAPEKLKDIRVWGTMLEGRLQPVGPVPRTGRAGAAMSSEGYASVPDSELVDAAMGQLARLISMAHSH